jgi:hypothetical protein
MRVQAAEGGPGLGSRGEGTRPLARVLRMTPCAPASPRPRRRLGTGGRFSERLLLAERAVGADRGHAMDRQQILGMLRGATLEPYQLGLSFRSQMIPPVPDRCVSVAAGPLRLVVEARHLDDRAVSRNLADEPAEGDDTLFDDYGPTVHVYGTADGIEHLRFDCFAHKPHYHYVHEGGAVNTVCRIDQFAEGDVVEWTIGRLRERLPEMLEYCGLPDLADQARTQHAEILGALEEVVHLLREARELATTERAAV